MNNDPFSLDGRVAVVTGAAGLLGSRHCRALARAGAHVVLTDVVPIGILQQTLAGLNLREMPAALCETSDVTSADSLTRLRDAVLKTFGRIDVLVNNAAVNDMVEHRTADAYTTAFERFPLDTWNRSFAVNVTGVFLSCQILGSVMAETGAGSIINIASTYGIVGPDQSLYVKPDGERIMYKSPAYSATKGALIAFTRFLAAYWGHCGIRVNALSPGGVRNNQDEFFVTKYSARTMLGRMAEPDDYEGAVVFLASDASRYMTGTNLVVDGGWTAW